MATEASPIALLRCYDFTRKTQKWVSDRGSTPGGTGELTQSPDSQQD